MSCARPRQWWDREFKDADQIAEAERREKEGLEPNPYDKGAPDWQSGEKKDLKFRTIVKGVRALIEEKKWDADKVVLWIDWQSIYQDDDEMKGKGVGSLIHWATQCEAMLVPTEYEGEVDVYYPDQLADYGTRGWVRAREHTCARAPRTVHDRAHTARVALSLPRRPRARACMCHSERGRAVASPIARALLRQCRGSRRGDSNPGRSLCALPLNDR